MEVNTKKVVLTALFAALACVATMIIRVPTFVTHGYVNIGDTIVLLAAWIIGGVYGALAAGIGSALADILSSYGQYAPGTFAIKFLMAIVAYLIFVAIKKINVNKVVGYILGGIAAEVVMVVGYFLYECTLLSYGLAAAASIPGNILQGVVCLVLAYVLVGVLEGTKAIYLIKKFV